MLLRHSLFIVSHLSHFHMSKNRFISRSWVPDRHPLPSRKISFGLSAQNLFFIWKIQGGSEPGFVVHPRAKPEGQGEMCERFSTSESRGFGMRM